MSTSNAGAAAFEPTPQRQLPRYVAANIESVEDPKVWDDGNVSQTIIITTNGGYPAKVYCQFNYNPAWLAEGFSPVLTERDRLSYTRFLAGNGRINEEKRPFDVSFLGAALGAEGLTEFIGELRKEPITPSSLVGLLREYQNDGKFKTFGACVKQCYKAVFQEGEKDPSEFIPTKRWKVEARRMSREETDETTKNRSGFFALNERSLKAVDYQCREGENGRKWALSFITEENVPF